MQRLKPWLKAFTKLGVSAGLIWLSLGHIDSETFLAQLQTLNISWFVVAVALYHLAQIISSLRLKFYAETERVALNAGEAISLYYRGMLLNLALPGGIGGDGYIAWKLNKQHNMAGKRAVQRMISARGSGLLALLMLAAALAYMVPQISNVAWLLFLVTIAVPITLACYTIIASSMLGESKHSQKLAFVLSLFIQLLNLAVAYCLMIALGIEGPLLAYLLVFLMACIASVVPLTLGGLGLREVAFVVLAPYFALSAEHGMALAFSYFSATVIASLFGIFPFLTRRT